MIFELEDVSYSYLKKYPALVDVNLEIERGESVAILGANGSGKSTLLHILDALIFPSSGTIKAFGRVLSEEILNGGMEFRKKVGLLFQNPDVQLFSPTVYDEIAFGPLQLENQGEVASTVDRVMKMLEIVPLKERMPHTLSGGEKKKVAIASVLSIDPEVLLLDEPTDGLDPRTQLWFMELIAEFRKMGKTVVTATHDLNFARAVTGRAVVVSEDHRILADGDGEKILSNRELLLKANLIHEHLHMHRDVVHSHSHAHLAEHEHEHF